MKVKEIIEALQKQDPEAEVIMKSENFELQGNHVPVRYVTSVNTGQRVVKQFRDAFDGCGYSKEVFRLFEGNETVVYFYD